MTTQSVLIVDDEPHIRYLLESKVAAAGYDVTTAVNGVQAFEIASAACPDLLITDFQMPGMSGLELCQRLKERADTANLAAIMLTARGHKIAMGDLAKTNIMELLPKPFSIRQVLEKIEEFFDTTRAAA